MSLNISLYKERDGWVDKYLVKRNSYQLLSAPVSIWLARAPGGEKQNISYFSTNLIFVSASSLSKVDLNILTKQATAGKCVMWNAFIYAWVKPHTSQFHLFVASLEKHLKVLRLLLLNFAFQIFFKIQIPREGFLFTNVESEEEKNHWEWEKCGDWSRKLIPILSGNLHDQDLSNKLPFQSNRKKSMGIQGSHPQKG